MLSDWREESWAYIIPNRHAELKKRFLEKTNRGFFCFFVCVLYSTLLHLPPFSFPLCWRMLESNPRLLQLWHWQSDTLTTRNNHGWATAFRHLSPVQEQEYPILYRNAPVPDCSRHRDFNSFWYRTDQMSDRDTQTTRRITAFKNAWRNN
jgi:hypothetical protein